jgi:hypothetical protein
MLFQQVYSKSHAQLDKTPAHPKSNRSEGDSMSTDTKAEPVGTGQAGAGAPAGVTKDVPIHIEGGKPVDKIEEVANRAAHKGIDRQHNEDSTIFTK